MLIAGLGLAAGQVRADGHETIVETHGYSFYGDLTYPADFEHFDYVNPDAPKGGEIALGVVGVLNFLLGGWNRRYAFRAQYVLWVGVI